MISVIEGQPIPLALKLFDQNAAAKVRADLYSTAGDFHARAYMFHLENGLYLNTTNIMPAFDLVVSYTVENSDEYADTAEQIKFIPKVQEPDKFVTGIVKSIKNDTEYIVGVVE